MSDQPTPFTGEREPKRNRYPVDAAVLLLHDGQWSVQSSLATDKTHHRSVSGQHQDVSFGDPADLYGTKSHKPFTAQLVSEAGVIDAEHRPKTFDHGKDVPGERAPNQPRSGADPLLLAAMPWGARETNKQQEETEGVLRRLGAVSGVDQGTRVGDCGFESSLAGLAHTKSGSEKIANMIVRNPDDSYTVTFPGDKQNSVNVTEADINQDKLTNSAQWANIIEAAAVKLKGHGINAIDGADAIELLTGRHADTDLIYHGLDNSDAIRIAAHIKQALDNGGVVIAGTNHKDSAVQGHHYYTVLHYDSESGTITMRNPHGDTNLSLLGRSKDGIAYDGAGEIQMSLATFMSDFDKLQYQGKPPGTGETIGQDASNAVHTYFDLPNILGSVL